MKISDLFPKREFPDETYKSDPEVILHRMMVNMAKQIDVNDRVIDDLLNQVQEQNKIIEAIMNRVKVNAAGDITILLLCPWDEDYPVMREFYEKWKEIKNEEAAEYIEDEQ